MILSYLCHLLCGQLTNRIPSGPTKLSARDRILLDRAIRKCPRCICVVGPRLHDTVSVTRLLCIKDGACVRYATRRLTQMAETAPAEMVIQVELPTFREVLSELFEDHPVRVICQQGKPLFVADDVGTALGLKNVRATVSKYEDNVRVTGSVLTADGMREMTLLTGQGVLRLIFKSTKSAARRFEDWVYNMITSPKTVATITHPTAADPVTSAIVPQIPEQRIVTTTPEQGPIIPRVSGTPISYFAPFHDVNEFRNKSIVYLFHLRDNEHKYGVTGDALTRFKAHAAEFGKHGCAITLVSVWICATITAAENVESCIKTFAMTRGHSLVKYKQTEIAQIEDLDDYKRRIDGYVSEENDRHERLRERSCDEMLLKGKEYDLRMMDARIRLAELENNKLELMQQIPQITH